MLETAKGHRHHSQGVNELMIWGSKLSALLFSKTQLPVLADAEAAIGVLERAGLWEDTDARAVHEQSASLLLC